MNSTEIKPDQVVGVRWLTAVERTLSTLSAAAIALMMFVVVAAVAARYFVNHPLGWTYDIIGSYLMVCAFFPAISDGLRLHSHIAIDIFRPRLPRSLTHLGMAVGYAASTVLLLLIAWQGWGRLQTSWLNSEMISMTVPWPTWPTYLLLCLGCLVMTLRCLVRTVAHAGSLLTGRELASLPPTASEHEVGGAE